MTTVITILSVNAEKCYLVNLLHYTAHTTAMNANNALLILCMIILSDVVKTEMTHCLSATYELPWERL